jgi:hypothetical protein
MGQEPPETPPDPLAHVQIGQRYVFSAAGVTRPSWEVWEVVALEEEVVHIVVTRLVEQGGVPTPEGDPEELSWTSGSAEGALAGWSEGDLEEITVASLTFRCQVREKTTDSGLEVRAWIPIVDGRPTFPGFVRWQVGGTTLVELTDVVPPPTLPPPEVDGPLPTPADSTR